MSTRRRRQRPWAGWVSDDRGPAVSLHADQPPTDAVVVAVLQLRDAAIRAVMLAEREAGRWEDDGGPSEPETTHRTYSLATGQQGGRKPSRWRNP